MKKIVSLLLVTVLLCTMGVLLVGCSEAIDYGANTWEIAVKNPETGEYVTGRYPSSVSMTLKYTGDYVLFYPVLRNVKTLKQVESGLSMWDMIDTISKDGVVLPPNSNPKERGDYNIKFEQVFLVIHPDERGYYAGTHRYSLKLSLTII